MRIGHKLLWIFIGLSFISFAHAAKPLWTMTPLTATTLTVSQNGTAQVNYQIENQTEKSVNLVIKQTSGVEQTAPCLVAPKGQAGSSCILYLLISGFSLPADGINGGPALCRANSDGTPNANQCYEPESGNTLQITRGNPIPAIISLNSGVLSFNAGGTGTVTVTNSIDSIATAKTIALTIPAGSNVTLQSTTCPTSLAIGASCTITLASPAAETSTEIQIRGSNTNLLKLYVTVN